MKRGSVTAGDEGAAALCWAAACCGKLHLPTTDTPPHAHTHSTEPPPHTHTTHTTHNSTLQDLPDGLEPPKRLLSAVAVHYARNVLAGLGSIPGQVPLVLGLWGPKVRLAVAKLVYAAK